MTHQLCTANNWHVNNCYKYADCSGLSIKFNAINLYSNFLATSKLLAYCNVNIKWQYLTTSDFNHNNVTIYHTIPHYITTTL